AVAARAPRTARAAARARARHRDRHRRVERHRAADRGGHARRPRTRTRRAVVAGLALTHRPSDSYSRGPSPVAEMRRSGVVTLTEDRQGFETGLRFFVHAPGDGRHRADMLVPHPVAGEDALRPAIGRPEGHGPRGVGMTKSASRTKYIFV